MNPAFSVLFLTTFIGAGQGLFLALYTVLIYAHLGILPAYDDRMFQAFGALVAFAWLGIGLFASFFHLGHPERGWRAITRWRSSWLSREVIVLPVFMATVFAYAAVYWLGIGDFALLGVSFPIHMTLVVGTIAMALAFLLFLCTGMVYGDVHLLPEWHHWLTILNFIFLGAASGFTLATGLASLLSPQLIGFLAIWSIVLTLTAALFRIAALQRNQHLSRRSSLRTAIGIRHHLIAQKSQGSMGGSFNTREFTHGYSDHAIDGLIRIFLALAFFIPVVLLIAARWYGEANLALIAFPVQLIGLIAERWYFFAQVYHPQNLYYQSVA